MKTILSRVNDYETRSKKWIVGYSLLFWISTKLLSVLLVVICTYIYETLGYSTDMFPSFGGTPKGAHTIGKLLFSLATVAIIAPLIEEIVFRLGLSFKKWQVALSLAFIPIFIVWSDIKSVTWIGGVVGIVNALLIFYAVYKLTTQEFWDRVKENRMVMSMWITSIAFGLIHFLAFSFISWEVLPYCLCMISAPFFMGCACAYLRVNLGFGWGLAMHIFNNIPGLITIIALSV